MKKYPLMATILVVGIYISVAFRSSVPDPCEASIKTLRYKVNDEMLPESISSARLAEGDKVTILWTTSGANQVNLKIDDHEEVVGFEGERTIVARDSTFNITLSALAGSGEKICSTDRSFRGSTYYEGRDLMLALTKSEENLYRYQENSEYISPRLWASSMIITVPCTATWNLRKTDVNDATTVELNLPTRTRRNVDFPIAGKYFFDFPPGLNCGTALTFLEVRYKN